jgi:hypothetical protein
MPNESDWDKNQKQYMDGIAKYIAASTVDVTQLGELEKYLTEIDRRRNLNWHTVFPWLDQHLQQILQ